MESSNATTTLSLNVAKFDPALTYAGASNLQLKETEMSALSAPFDDLEYELTPQGHIYLPQALSAARLNAVLGIGNWSLLLINTGAQEMANGSVKVFYDGALLIRNCFVSRSAGEATYFKDNSQQSYATALEAAKSDCRQRCCKDIGIANDAWNPTFVRRWRKEHGVRVIVKDDKTNKTTVIWRRKDLDPYPNEIGIAPDAPTVPQKQQQPVNKGLVTPEWKEKVKACEDLKQLTALYNENRPDIDSWPQLQQHFSDRRDFIKTKMMQSA